MADRRKPAADVSQPTPPSLEGRGLGGEVERRHRVQGIPLYESTTSAYVHPIAKYGVYDYNSCISLIVMTQPYSFSDRGRSHIKRPS